MSVASFGRSSLPKAPLDPDSMFDSFSEMFLDAYNANVSEFVFLVRIYRRNLKHLFDTLLILLLFL